MKKKPFKTAIILTTILSGLILAGAVELGENVVVENSETTMLSKGINLDFGFTDGDISISENGIKLNEDWFNITSEDSENVEPILWNYDPEGNPALEIEANNSAEYEFSIENDNVPWKEEYLVEFPDGDTEFLDLGTSGDIEFQNNVEASDVGNNFTLTPINSIEVEWAHYSPGEGVAGFLVYRNTTENPDVTQIEETTDTGEIDDWKDVGEAQPDPPKTDYGIVDDSPDDANQLYCYRVIAFGPGGLSDASEEKCGTLSEGEVS